MPDNLAFTLPRALSALSIAFSGDGDDVERFLELPPNSPRSTLSVGDWF